jgi:MauM/NapG family ferredoxin protein
MIHLRRASQLLFLALFVYLVIATQADIVDTAYGIRSPLPAYLFFTSNPLTFLSVVASTKQIIAIDYLPMLVLVGLALIFGRYFCGWVCPLGTCIDATAHVLRPRPDATGSSGKSAHIVKFYVLIALLLIALLGMNLVGFIDPITIMMRSTTYSLLPYSELLVRGALDPLYNVPLVNHVSEPLYSFLKRSVLSISQPYYQNAFLYFCLFLLVLGLTAVHKRFWCRYVCPLGAFYGYVGQVGVVRRRVDEKCTQCGLCEKRCRMQSIKEPAELFDHRECIQCMECQAICPVNAIHFSVRPRQGVARDTVIDVSRRGFLRTVGLSIVVFPLLRVGQRKIVASEFLIRPPGAVPEAEFLQKCVRCGECMRVCPGNALHPALFQAGPEGLWTPVLIPRIGYCVYNCTLCGSVCPTGAIEALSLPAKQITRIGTAYFDRNRCIPWNDLQNCSVCEEACPTSPKAIKLVPTEVVDDQGNRIVIKQPYMVEEHCIGCGICETKCPLEGTSAILVTSRNESRAARTQQIISEGLLL